MATLSLVAVWLATSANSISTARDAGRAAWLWPRGRPEAGWQGATELASVGTTAAVILLVGIAASLLTLVSGSVPGAPDVAGFGEADFDDLPQQVFPAMAGGRQNPTPELPPAAEDQQFKRAGQRGRTLDGQIAEAGGDQADHDGTGEGVIDPGITPESGPQPGHGDNQDEGEDESVVEHRISLGENP